jgi:hypothetical protein
VKTDIEYRENEKEKTITGCGSHIARFRAASRMEAARN